MYDFSGFASNTSIIIKTSNILKIKFTNDENKILIFLFLNILLDVYFVKNINFQALLLFYHFYSK